MTRSGKSPTLQPITMTTSAESLAVTVIIPAFNEERWLPVCLERLTSGTLDRGSYEILVIDNGSTDRTPEIAAQFADEVITLKGENVSILRNRAAEKARGVVLAFLDADCIPADDWLEAGLASLESEPCVTGARYRLPENPAWVERDWDPMESPPGTRERTNFIPAGNLFIHRERFLRLGGFNPSLSAGEDKELCARASREVPVYDDSRIRVVHEGNPKTLKQFVKREIWHGRGALGSLRTNWRDKMIACSFGFAIATLLQVAGLILFLFVGSPWMFAAGTLGVLGILGLVLIYRRRQLRGIGHAIRFAFLNYAYFIGRTIALFNCLFSIDYYHGITSTAESTVKTEPAAESQA
jgi:glycosyltransferase involved in cell wall biosynthesis